MSLSISKDNQGMIDAAAVHAGLHGQAQTDFVAAVSAQLDSFGDPLGRAKGGFSDHSAGHVASAISMVLGRGK